VVAEKKKRNGGARVDLAHRPRLRLFLEGLQQAPSPVFYHAFHVPCRHADRQRGDGGDQRLGQARDALRLQDRRFWRRAADYIRFFNEERPSYALGYLTPAQFKAKYAGKPDQPKKPSKIASERKKERIGKENQK